MEKTKIVIYTAISGNYDNLREPRYISRNCDYICFTDNQKLTSNIWEIKPLQLIRSDFVRSARRAKILPHLYLADYEISIWVDGNFSIIGDVCELAEKVLLNHNIALFKHPNNRSSVYEEAKKCIELKKDNSDIIRRQVKKYASEGLPANPIPMTGVIFRRHNDHRIIKTMEDWWTEVCSQSRRDQLSFNYVAWRNGLEYNLIDDNGTSNKWLEKESHRLSKKKQFYKKLKKMGAKSAAHLPFIKSFKKIRRL